MKGTHSMECRSCGQRLKPREPTCPTCGSPAPPKRAVRVVAVAGVSVAVVAVLAVLAVQRQWVPLRTSSVVREAMARVATNPLVTGALGQPVHAGSVLGNITHDETGWTEAILSIPVSGPTASGTLYVRAGRASGSWTFSSLELRVNGGQPMNLLEGRELVHQEPPGEPEFMPNRSGTNRPDGRYPCFVASAASNVSSIDARTTECLPGLRTDRLYDEVEVNLRGGFLVLRKTDMFVQDTLPLAFTRCFRMWDAQSRAFGVGWNHPYDILPVGTRNPYTYIDLIMPDGDPIHFNRISEGTGYADAVYEHTATTTPFFRSTMQWNGNGWDLRFADGALFLFPENYAGTRPHHGAPIAMEDGHGHAIQFQRDNDRNLVQLTSPSGHTIRLEHDGASRVTSAADERGRTIRYTYDARGNLAAVNDGKEIVRYSYIDSNLIAVATGASADPDNASTQSVLRVQYADGRVSGLTFADGRSYHFRFNVAEGSNVVSEATVIAPDGSETSVSVPSPERK
jgi:YD repeat-containing protein